MDHVRGAPYHPMTQGKIERWHQTLKNRILLEHYYLPGDLEAQIDAFVGTLQSLPLPREPRQSYARRCLLRARPDHLIEQRKDQMKNIRTPTLARRKASRLNQPNR